MEFCEVSVRLTPRASRNEVLGEREGVLIVRVTAPAVDDRANEALRRLIAKRARVGVRSVRIVRGARAREKVLRVEGLSAGGLREVLGLPRIPENET
jgi:uncharacterized protein YggU (UPF0235/DUF167 family)